MMGVVTSVDPERRLAEALRAQATGGPGRPEPARRAAPDGRGQVRWALLIALLGGAVLGTAIALLSVLVPGLLPAIG
jgi:hypothetical protein